MDGGSVDRPYLWRSLACLADGFGQDITISDDMVQDGRKNRRGELREPTSGTASQELWTEGRSVDGGSVNRRYLWRSLVSLADGFGQDITISDDMVQDDRKNRRGELREPTSGTASQELWTEGRSVDGGSVNRRYLWRSLVSLADGFGQDITISDDMVQDDRKNRRGELREPTSGTASQELRPPNDCALNASILALSVERLRVYKTAPKTFGVER